MSSPMLRGMGSAFNPRTLAGAYGVYRTDRDTDSSQVTDPLGRHLVQATPGNQPAFSDVGFKRLIFDGVDNYMSFPDMPTGPGTICLAFQFSSTPGASTLWNLARSKQASAVFAQVMVINAASYKDLSWIFEGAGAGATARGIDHTHDTNPHILVISYDGVSPTTSTSYRAYLDFNHRVVLTSNTLNSTSATAISSLGARAIAAGLDSPAYAGPLTFVRGFTRNTATSATEAMKLSRWLAKGFTSPPALTPAFYFVGNSIVRGFGTTIPGGQLAPNSLPEQLMGLLGGPSAWGCYNLGVDSRVTPTIRDTWSTEVAPLVLASAKRPKRVLCVLEGGNDIWLNGASAEVAATHLAEVTALGKGLGMSVVLGTVFSRDPQGTPSNETNRVALNNMIRASAASWGVDRVVNLDQDPRLDDYTDTTYIGDGTHPNNTGAGVVAELYYDQIVTL